MHLRPNSSRFLFVKDVSSLASACLHSFSEYGPSARALNVTFLSLCLAAPRLPIETQVVFRYALSAGALFQLASPESVSRLFDPVYGIPAVSSRSQQPVLRRYVSAAVCTSYACFSFPFFLDKTYILIRCLYRKQLAGVYISCVQQ